jgi:hypothetical protein
LAHLLSVIMVKLSFYFETWLSLPMILCIFLCQQMS